MKNITVVTSTRAEYGLLKSLIEKIEDDEDMCLQLVVTGTHLSKKYGMTINEILEDGLPVAVKMPIMDDERDAPSNVFANATTRFTQCIKELRPDAAVLYGDRFEIMAIACACLLCQVPIVHISGGDVTFGAIDEACRHCISKMASLHFTGNQTMRKRVVQMGENPKYVFDTGDLAVDNFLSTKTPSREELAEMLNFDILNNDFAIVTFHPVTTERGRETEYVSALMEALDETKNLKYIITKSNCDDGGATINDYIERFVRGNDRYLFVASLGMKKYLAALKYSRVMIGNSSSGIVEAPLFKIPTVNIGNRQEGREQVASIINCLPEKNDIKKAIQSALSPAHRKVTQSVASVYGDGHAAEKMHALLREFIVGEKLNCKKRFYDIAFDLEENI